MDRNKDKELLEFFYDCSDYMSEKDGRKSSHEIINNGVVALDAYPQFSELHDRCVFISNGWSVDDLEDWSYQSDELIEDMCGYLGEFFA